jgi:hypothetical protein
MLFLPASVGGAATWGANQPGSPVIGADSAMPPSTTIFIPVRRWSDGSPDAVAPLPQPPAAAKPG